MSKKKKPEEAKPSIEDLHKTIKDVKKLADDSKVMLEDKVKSKPLESATMIFMIGLVLGILIGSARRS